MKIHFVAKCEKFKVRVFWCKVQEIHFLAHIFDENVLIFFILLIIIILMPLCVRVWVEEKITSIKNFIEKFYIFAWKIF